ncbi:MAG: hypothetical protein ABI551_06240 [Polyangiaceae bacterium]
MDLERDPAVLRARLPHADASERAFLDSVNRIGFSRMRADASAERAEREALREELRMAALRAHAPLRSRIAAGALRGAELRSILLDLPLADRDHVVEEILGVAYPPLEEPAREAELVPYQPSSLDEILHACDESGLARADRFLDIGSGTGKVTLLAHLLTGAAAIGIERDPALHAVADEAARALHLPTTQLCADARDHLVPCEVVFMFLPFTGLVLEAVMDRLNELRPRCLCASAIDLTRRAELVEVAQAQSWLHIYRWR